MPKEEYFLEMIHQVKPIEPVLEIAKRLYTTVPMAVASGGYRKYVELTLDAIGVRGLFEAVVLRRTTNAANHSQTRFWRLRTCSKWRRPIVWCLKTARLESKRHKRPEWSACSSRREEEWGQRNCTATKAGQMH